MVRTIRVLNTNYHVKLIDTCSRIYSFLMLMQISGAQRIRSICLISKKSLEMCRLKCLLKASKVSRTAFLSYTETDEALT